MKRKTFFWIAALFLTTFATLSAAAQTAKVPTRDPNPDYSSFGYFSTDHNRILHNIIAGEDYTAVQIKITIKNSREGQFSFPKNAYLSGSWGSLLIRGLRIRNTNWELDKPYAYSKNSYNSSFVCTLFFDRIPAGVTSLDYCEPGIVRWENIPVTNCPTVDSPEHTEWTQALLKERWKEGGCSPIEGIYTSYIATDNPKWRGSNKLTLAVLKTGEGYDLIYLKGSLFNKWREGDIKARFIPTAEPGLYKVSTWYAEDRTENEDYYITFKDQRFYIYETDGSNMAGFLKLFPANESPQLSDKSTGSGVVLDRQGVIATNYHVIENAEAINVSVKNSNGIATYEAEVLCTDKANDLALIQIKGRRTDSFPAIPYAIPSKTFDVGTSVFAMGYPMVSIMGDEVKITDGIINAKTGYQGDVATYQISAPIQPGNSGGPLFDKKGNLAGITRAKIPGASNVGYAIKTAYLRNLIESAPIHIEIPEKSELAAMELPEQIKRLSDFVVQIKVR